MEQIWTDVKARMAYLRRLSVVFAFELRIKIVTELYLREMSAKQFYDEFGGGSVSRVAKHFKKLAEEGWLRYIRTETGGSRRGAREHFYRATELAIFDEQTWALVPYSVRVAISWRTFEILAERVRDALKADTLDARDDSHLSWTKMLLDQLGWERVTGAIEALFESIFEEQNDAKLRIAHSGENRWWQRWRWLLSNRQRRPRTRTKRTVRFTWWRPTRTPRFLFRCGSRKCSLTSCV